MKHSRSRPSPNRKDLQEACAVPFGTGPIQDKGRQLRGNRFYKPLEGHLPRNGDLTVASRKARSFGVSFHKVKREVSSGAASTLEGRVMQPLELHHTESYEGAGGCTRARDTVVTVGLHNPVPERDPLY